MGRDIDNGDGTVDVHQQDIKEKNEAMTNLGDVHQDKNNVNVTVANLDNLHQAGHRADKEKNEAVTNLGDSHQDGHKGGGKTKKKTEIGRELQVRTTTGGDGRATRERGCKRLQPVQMLGTH